MTAFLLVFTLMWLHTAGNETMNDIFEMSLLSIPYYWNVPTFQCDTHKLNFTYLAAKYGIIQNLDDRFRGEHIDILYDPGDFPALLRDGASTIQRNGGVPQAGNLTLHLEIFEETVETLIREDFSGLAIIDFESWRPIYRQNFGSLSPYKDLSIALERKTHPLWPNFFIEKEATRKFEFHARKFMEETLFVAKQLRPNATWGYYGYPYCFNMSPSNMKLACPSEVSRENDRIEWLFTLTDNLHPSLYLSELTLTANEKIEMIQGRINEANRIAGFVKITNQHPRIVPYFWYKYRDSGVFVSKEDLFNSFVTLASLKIDALVIWGSSNDVNTKQKCTDLYNYIDDVLGPALMHNFN